MSSFDLESIKDVVMEWEAQSASKAAEDLNNNISQTPDGNQVKFGEMIDKIRTHFVKYIPDYNNPKEVIVIPLVDAQVINLSDADEKGKGPINELAIRSLFETYASKSSGASYIVVHNHTFCAHKLRVEKKAVLGSLQTYGVDTSRGLTDLNQEQDFVLLHPTRGLIFVEVKGFDTSDYPETFTKLCVKASKQCLRGFTYMKAYIMQHILHFQKERFSKDELKEKLDLLFERFTRVIMFPSLSKQILGGARLADLSLGENVKVYFKEDRRNPSDMIKDIEKSFVDIEDGGFYGLVYQTALACCFVMNDGLKKLNFTPNEHLGTMDKIFLDFKQSTVRACKERVLFIDGIAGSGKTLICVQKMEDLAQKYPNQRILYLCCNKHLAESVRRELKPCSFTNIEVWYWSEWLKSHRHLVSSNPRKKDPRGKKKNYADKLLSNNENRVLFQQKYQFVFIDEYQDIRPLMRRSLEATFMKPLLNGSFVVGAFYVFYDNRQRVTFLEDKIQDPQLVRVPKGVREVKLQTVYRSSRQIAHNFLSYAPDEICDMGHEYDGLPIRIVFPTYGESLDELLSTILTTLMQEHNIYYNDVVILHRNAENMQNCVLQHNTSKCKHFTIHSFKGLESKVVINCNPHVIWKSRRIDLRVAQHYTAGSRALWMYIILVNNENDKRRLEDIMNSRDYTLISESRNRALKRERELQRSNKAGSSAPKKKKQSSWNIAAL